MKRRDHQPTTPHAPVRPRHDGGPWTPLLVRRLLIAAAFLGSAAPLLAAGPIARNDDIDFPLRPLQILIDPLANDSHPDGEALTVTTVSPPSAGSIDGPAADGTFVFSLQAPLPTSGRVTFSYTVKDEHGRTADAEVCVGHCPSHIPNPSDPTCDPEDDQYFGVEVGEVLDVLENDNETTNLCQTIYAVQPAGIVEIGPGGGWLTFVATTPGPHFVKYYATGPQGPGSAGVEIFTPGGGGTSIEMGEVGRIVELTHQEKTVSLLRSYDVPVVLAMPATRTSTIPAIVQVTEVGSDSFRVRLLNASGGGSHPKEAVDYLVVEAGRWKVPGTQHPLIANVTETKAVVPVNGGHGQGERIDLAELGVTLGSPVVFAQVQSRVNQQWYHTRVFDVVPSEFSFALERWTGGTYLPNQEEAVGWFATSAGNGGWSGADTVAKVQRCATWAPGAPTGQTWFCTLFFDRTFAGEPFLLANLSSWEHATTGDPRDMHLRRNPVNAPYQAVAAISEANNGESTDPRLDPHDVAFLAIRPPGGQPAILSGEPINRPPRVPAFEETVTGPGGHFYVPVVHDADGDPFVVTDVEQIGNWPLGWTLHITADQRIQILQDPTAPPLSTPASFRYRVRDVPSEASMPSRWGTVEVRYHSGLVVTAVDDHYASIPALELWEHEGVWPGEPWPEDTLRWTIPDAVLKANDYSTPQGGSPNPPGGPELAIPAFQVGYPSCGQAFEDPSNPAQLIFQNRIGSQGSVCPPGEVTHSYYLCEAHALDPETCQFAVDTYDVGVATIRIRRQNLPPVAHDDAYSIQRGVPTYLPVLANDTDPDGQVPILTGVVAPPAHGEALALADGTVRYRSDTTYVGSDAFDYQISDAPPDDPPASDVGHVTITVTRDLTWEDFHNESGARPEGSPLHGVRVHEGSGQWTATGILLAGDVGTTNGTGAGGHAALRLPRIPLSASSVVAVEAQVTLGAGAWAGAGLTAHENLSLLAHGTLWVTVSANGQWQLRQGGATVVASGPAPLFTASEANLVRVEYDRLSSLAHVWINGVRVLAGFAVGDLDPTALEVAAFQVRHPQGAPAGSMTVDDFTVYYREDPTPVSAAVGDDFSPKSTDRTPGRSLDRVWSSEGDARWEAEKIAFAEGGTAALAPSGLSLDPTLHGRAALPFAPANFPGQPGLFLDATFTLGSADWIGFGFVRNALPDFSERDGEVWWTLDAAGAWELWVRGERGASPVESGQLPGFDPDVPRHLRLEISGGGGSVTVWLDRDILTGFYPFAPMTFDVRGAALELERPQENPATDRIDAFRAGVLEVP